jgi:ethanolamine utilization protein EutN
MILAKVTSSVVATRKNEGLEGHRLLVVRPVDEKGGWTGTALLAVDRVDAGEGDRVLVMKEGGGARLMLGDRIPVQAVVVAVVDRVTIDRAQGLG